MPIKSSTFKIDQTKIFRSLLKHLCYLGYTHSILTISLQISVGAYSDINECEADTHCAGSHFAALVSSRKKKAPEKRAVDQYPPPD